MKRLVQVLTVAIFEFQRVVKLKDAIVTLVLFSVGGLVYAWFGRMSDPVQAPISVLGDELRLDNADHLPFTFLQVHGDDEESLRRKQAAGEYGALLLVRSIEDVEIVFRDERPSWYPELLAVVAQARQLARLRAAGLLPEGLGEDAAETRVSVQEEQDTEDKEQRELLAVLCVGAMMMGVLLGNVHLFTGITGEKQSRVTESVVSAIPVQTWIDGKLVGLTVVAVYGLAVTAFSWGVANELYGLFHEKVRIPVEVVDSSFFAALLLLTGLGFLMWFAFFGAVACTIDDPNTSSRSVLMFVPILVVALAFPGIDSPDTGLFRFASIFPLTSSAAMPVRMVMGEPATWELALTPLLLVAAIWLFRRLAGKVFGLGMLTYGTEPSLGDLWRAFRAS